MASAAILDSQEVALLVRKSAEHSVSIGLAYHFRNMMIFHFTFSTSVVVIHALKCLFPPMPIPTHFGEVFGRKL